MEPKINVQLQVLLFLLLSTINKLLYLSKFLMIQVIISMAHFQCTKNGLSKMWWTKMIPLFGDMPHHIIVPIASCVTNQGRWVVPRADRLKKRACNSIVTTMQTVKYNKCVGGRNGSHLRSSAVLNSVVGNNNRRMVSVPTQLKAP